MKRLVLAYIGLNALDLALTIPAVQAGAIELNPIMRHFLEGDLATLLAFKIGLAAVFAGALYVLGRKKALRFCCYVVAGICLFNFTGMLLAGQLGV